MNQICNYSNFQDVHETAAGALWNLAFNPGNALRIVEDGGVAALVRICTSSLSKMARFMAALALAYMFDGRYRFRMLVFCSIHNSLSAIDMLINYTSMMVQICFHRSF